MLATLRIWTMPFVYDDAEWMAQSAAQWSVGAVPFRFAQWLGDGLPRAAHAVVLGLHLINGLLLWVVSRRWLSETGALLALTLFWLHPLPLQAVFYVTGGREVWLTTLTLLAVLGGLHGGVLGWTLGISAWLSAVGVKTSALPVLLAVPFVWACARGYGRLLAVLLVCVGLSTTGPWALSSEAVRTWAVSLTRYLGFVAWPDGFSIVHDWRVVSPAIGGVALAGLLWLGVVAWSRSRAAWWAWLWVVALTCPRALVSGPTLTEAQMYLPLVAVWIAIGLAVDGFKEKRVYG